MAANRKWKCPEDKHAAVVAPEKGMRKDDVRRFCLDCSVEVGRLVHRVCPVAERRRERQTERRRTRAKKRARKKARREQAPSRRERQAQSLRWRRENVRHRLAAIDGVRDPYLLHGIDLHEQLEHLLSLDVVPQRLRAVTSKLHLRNCEYPPGQWGFADMRKGRPYISVSVWPGIGPGAMLAHLCHELAHLVAWDEVVARKPHGPAWREAYVKIAEEGYGVRVEEPAGKSRCDLDDVVALALSPVGREMMRRAKAERN